MSNNSKHSKFNFIYLFLAIIVASLGIWQYIELSKIIQVSFTEEQIQQKINETPLKPISKLGINANIHHLKIDFLETDKVLVDSDFLVYGFSMEAIGKGQVKTSIRYDNGNFYIHEPVFRDFSLTVQKKRNEIEKLKNVLVDSFNNLKNQFTEEEKTGLGNLAKSFVYKYEPQVKLLLEKEMTRILTNKPIYSLNDKTLKHKIAALALQDIRFTDKEVIATFKPNAILQSPIIVISFGLFILLILAFLFLRKT